MLPTDAIIRKGIPVYSGFVCYFPHAIAACAELSRIANEQHNPGEPLHWAKEKSSDELDALMRHTLDAAIDPKHHDPDGVHPAVKRMWRACADVERLHDAGVDIFAQPVEEIVISEADFTWILDEPHEPTREEVIDMERPASPKAIDVTYVDYVGENLYYENTRGPFASVGEALTFIKNNPDNLPGFPYVTPHTTED